MDSLNMESKCFGEKDEVDYISPPHPESKWESFPSAPKQLLQGDGGMDNRIAQRIKSLHSLARWTCAHPTEQGHLIFMAPQ